MDRCVSSRDGRIQDTTSLNRGNADTKLPIHDSAPFRRYRHQARGRLSRHRGIQLYPSRGECELRIRDRRGRRGPFVRFQTDVDHDGFGPRHYGDRSAASGGADLSANPGQGGPANPQALHMLGVLAARVGQHAAAEEARPSRQSRDTPRHHVWQRNETRPGRRSDRSCKQAIRTGIAPRARFQPGQCAQGCGSAGGSDCRRSGGCTVAGVCRGIIISAFSCGGRVDAAYGRQCTAIGHYA